MGQSQVGVVWMSVAGFMSAFLISGLARPSNLFAETTAILSNNRSFEGSTDGWSASGVRADVLTRNFIFGNGTGLDRFETNNAFGVNYARIAGTGSLGQAIVIPAGSNRHLLNAYAYIEPLTSADTFSAYAAICVGYYDANWKALDTITVPIAFRDAAKNRGTHDGLNFYAWGIKVPSQAKYVYLYVYCNGKAVAYCDNIALFDCKFESPTPLASNLVLNPWYNMVYPSTGVPALGFGIEFWEPSVDWSDPTPQYLGSRNQSEVLYQIISIKPNSTYSWLGRATWAGSWPRSVGIDFFDASWKPIGKTVIDLTNAVQPPTMAEPTFGRRITTPANAAYASVFVYSDKLPSSVPPQAISFFVCNQSLYLQDTVVNSGMSSIATSFSPVYGRYGPTHAVVRVFLSDADGINLSSVDLNDVHFVSRTNATKTYPVIAAGIYADDGDRMGFAEYSISLADAPDVGALVLKSNQIFDKKGNAAPAKRFDNLKYDGP